MPSAPDPAQPRRTRDAERTKAAILSAARERFAADGLEQATIRAIAADAGIDPAMVMRYYGSKEQLFAEAARVDLPVPDFSDIPRDAVGATMARVFVERYRDAKVLPILLLGARTRHPAADRLHQTYRDQLAAALTTLGCSHAVERASLASSHIIGLIIGRFMLFDDLRDMDDDTLAERIAPALQHYLVEPW